MISKQSEYLTQLEETINNQILSGELNINDFTSSYKFIISSTSSQSQQSQSSQQGSTSLQSTTGSSTTGK